MCSQILIFITLVFLASTCDGIEKKSVHMQPQGIFKGLREAINDADLKSDATVWRIWKPWKLLNWGQSMLNKGLTRSHGPFESDLERRYSHHDGSRGKIKNKKTVTRRDSSLIVSKQIHREDRYKYDTLSTARGASTVHFPRDTGTYIQVRHPGSVEKEIVALMFDSMLGCIVESWDVIVEPTSDSQQNAGIDKTLSELTLKSKKRKSIRSVQKEIVAWMFDSMLECIIDSWDTIVQPKSEPQRNDDIGKTPSELTLSYTSKKRRSVVKPSKTKRSRSKIEEGDSTLVDILQRVWFSSPDERAIIRFRNGNTYEGNISMKCMHGVGRFQWTDGTIYLGHFKNNEINGRGMIQWKDDTWYEGDFAGNLRHGRGLYVDSRNQRSYAGTWNCGTKHGSGVIYYSETFKNSYDGQWDRNVRHGFGSREYCPMSGYKGEWDRYLREGRGIMIWPNHDFYQGEWKNGIMSGYGMYIWNTYYNNSMSLSSLAAYRGNWAEGQRNGYGFLNLGFGLGSHYKGEFKNNKKHGVGKLVTNSGLIIQDKCLFVDDNIGSMVLEEQSSERFQFDMCDNTVGLKYHIEQTLKNIDKEQQIRSSIIMDYVAKNKAIEMDVWSFVRKDDTLEALSDHNTNLEDILDFEEISLKKALRCYETDLKNVYYKYSTICNIEEINFRPILSRLYLWQLYYDCNVHQKGLTLVDIDRIFHQNPEWLARYPHNPFEKIYFWQFIHSLISVACKLYAQRQLPDKKPDTIVAKAFRTFMENDLLAGAGRRKGKLANGYGTFMPLKALYNLYRSIGEPHTVRAFLCAVRISPHLYMDRPQPPLAETPDQDLRLGHNTYIFGDDMMFIVDDHISMENEDFGEQYVGLKLFNFANLSSKAIVKILTQIFPQLYQNGRIMNLDAEITFYEFFEAFVASAEESIRLRNEAVHWNQMIAAGTDVA